MTHAKRFYEKVALGGFDACWHWIGAKSVGGGKKAAYGRFRYKGKAIGAHRVSWMLHHKKIIPYGRDIDHLCKNTLCVNPGHLQMVAKHVNWARSEETRRLRRMMVCLSIAHYTSFRVE